MTFLLLGASAKAGGPDPPLRGSTPKAGGPAPPPYPPPSFLAAQQEAETAEKTAETSQELSNMTTPGNVKGLTQKQAEEQK